MKYFKLLACVSLTTTLYSCSASERISSASEYEVTSDCPSAESKGKVRVSGNDFWGIFSKSSYEFPGLKTFGFPSDTIFVAGPHRLFSQVEPRLCETVVFSESQDEILWSCWEGQTLVCTVFLRTTI